jgi:hypothetical protein
VSAAIGSSGQPPDHPGIDIAEERFAPAGSLADTSNVIEDPFALWSGVVGSQGETRLGTEAILAAILGQLVADFLGAGILPDDSIVVGITRLWIPDEGGLALVGDSYRGNVSWTDFRFIKCALDDILRASPNFQRVVLNPAGLGEDLLVLQLVNADHPS